MRICVKCHKGPVSESWDCPTCYNKPSINNGYLTFSPELIGIHEGFPPERYPILDKIESGNFWFCSRNKLIIWVLERFFSGINNFMEIGCGTGFVLSGISRAFPRLMVSASEVDPAGLSFVAKNSKNANLFQMDARNIPFKDEFDAIGAFDVIEHIDEDEKVLKQMFNACKPGGGIIVTVPQHPRLWSSLDVYAHHKRRYTRKELTGKIRNAGFHIEKCISFVSLLLPLMVLSRLTQKSIDNVDSMKEHSLPVTANRIFEAIMSFERTMIKVGFGLPIGGSLLCVGMKK